VDGAGNAIAVWSQFDGSNYRIYANNYTGSAWSSTTAMPPGAGPIVLSTAGSDAVLPQIAYSPDGTAIAVWEQSGRIHASRFDGSPWSAPAWSAAATLDDGGGTASAPQIAIDASNDGIAVWAQDSQVYASRYSSGVWTRQSIGNGAGVTAATQRALEYDGGNTTDAVAVWTQSDGVRNNIWARRFNDGVWISPAELLDNGFGNAQTPRVAMSTNGSAIAVWVQPAPLSPARFRIRASRLAGGTWTPAANPVDSFPTGFFSPVFEQAIVNEGISTEPHIAMDIDGNAIVLWTLQWTLLDDDDEEVIFNRIAGVRYRGPKANENIRGWSAAAIIEIDNPDFFGDSASPGIVLAPNLTGKTVWSKANNTNTMDPNQRRFSIVTSLFD
jgi:hypothetical protein